MTPAIIASATVIVFLFLYLWAEWYVATDQPSPPAVPDENLDSDGPLKTCQWQTRDGCTEPPVAYVVKSQAWDALTRYVCRHHQHRAIEIGWELTPSHYIRPIAQLLRDHIATLDNEELRGLVATPLILTSTNCCYVDKWVADSAALLADDQLRIREWTTKKAFMEWFTSHWAVAA